MIQIISYKYSIWLKENKKKKRKKKKRDVLNSICANIFFLYKTYMYM